MLRLLIGLHQLFSLAQGQWSPCPGVTVSPLDLDTVSIWTDGVVSRLGIGQPTNTSTASSVTAKTASIAKCSAECSFPLSTYVTTVGTQSSFLHIQEPLSFLVPAYFTRFPTNETIRCVAYEGSCGATVPLFRHYRVTAFGVQHAYSFSPDISYQDFIKEGNPVCYFWPSGVAADPSSDTADDIPDSELVTLNYFDNQAAGSLRDHYATTLTTVSGYTMLSPLGKVATNASSQCDEMIALVQLVDNQNGAFARLDHKVIVENQESNRLFEQYTPTSERFYCVARAACGASQPLWKMYDYINLDSLLSLTPSSTLSAYLYPNAPLCYIWSLDYTSDGELLPNSSTPEAIVAVGGEATVSPVFETTLLPSLLPETTVGSTGEAMTTSPEEISTTIVGSTGISEEASTFQPVETTAALGESSSTGIAEETTTIVIEESSGTSAGTTEFFSSMGTTAEEEIATSNFETTEATVGSTLPQQGSTAFNLPPSLQTTEGLQETTLGLETTTIEGMTVSGNPTVAIEEPIGTTVVGNEVSEMTATMTWRTSSAEVEVSTIGGQTTGSFSSGSTVEFPPATTVTQMESTAPILTSTLPGVGSTAPVLPTSPPMDSTLTWISTVPSTLLPISSTTQLTWESLFPKTTASSRPPATPAADVTSIPTEMATTRPPLETTIAVEAPATTPATLPFINITELTKTTVAAEPEVTVAPISPSISAHDPIVMTTPPSSEITVVAVTNGMSERPETVATPAASLLFTVSGPGAMVGDVATISTGLAVPGPAAHNTTQIISSVEGSSTVIPTGDSTDLFSLNG